MENLLHENPLRNYGLWSTPGVPHKGWICTSVDELENGEESEICEMCQHQQIRWIHHMSHVDYPEILCVGCNCAGFMMQDKKLAERMAHRAKNRKKKITKIESQRANVINKDWKLSIKGNPVINLNGIVFVLKRHINGWSHTYKEKGCDWSEPSNIYMRIEDAKNDAFNIYKEIAITYVGK